MSMFCYQCEETAKGSACTSVGICGKQPEIAGLQDLLMHAAKGISMYAHRAGELGARDNQVDRFAIDIAFTTVTNVDFDSARLGVLLEQAISMRTRARTLYEKACADNDVAPSELAGAATWLPATADERAAELELVSITKRRDSHGSEVAGLQDLIIYGLKGTAAYIHHATTLGRESDEIYALYHQLLSFVADEPTEVGDLLGNALKTGELNLLAMAALHEGNTSGYGAPEPTEVRTTAVAGKAILVSGHDLKDLELLLEQSRDRGVNVYTHGEMLPCLAYPGLKKYPHLVGNYGGAWQDQRREFESFPGAILMTTNCIQKPKENYQARIFTTGLVGWPGVTHVADKDFSVVIDAALAAPGFAADEPKKTITIGFGADAVLGVADKVIDAVKQGAVRHFFLIGGCDGHSKSRSYYTDLATAVPDDCVILTLGCGKYRFNKLDFGDIGGIPRLLDVGQCNDAYSAIKIASALADAFSTDVNSLPLSIVLSWYEQKAIAVLLTLLHLGITNIRVGPTLPAFIGENALGVLVDKFKIAPTGDPTTDLAALLN